jgi:hypothetical protein
MRYLGLEIEQETGNREQLNLKTFAFRHFPFALKLKSFNVKKMVLLVHSLNECIFAIKGELFSFLNVNECNFLYRK